MQDFHSQPDDVLVRAIRQSNPHAFKVLFHRYHDALVRFFAYRIRSSEIVKDCAQEVFVRLWHKREDLDPKQNVKGYLYRMAENLVVDHLRKKSHEKAYLAEKAAGDSSFRPDQTFDLRESIYALLSTLPEEQQTVFLLNRYEGFKYAEIAKILDISVKTVESRMSKVLKAMRESLQDYL